MGKSRSRQKPSLNTELQIAYSDRLPDKALMSKLERVIEEFLPGDFSAWEKEHSRRRRGVKIVDATQRNPNTRASAWSILCAYEHGEELFGFADRSKDEAALRDLEEALAQGLYALRNLSTWTRMSLGRSSFEKMSGVVNVPADMVLEACAAALKDGIEAARQEVATKGTPSSKEERRSAAVVGECREIYEARTGRSAPTWVRDDYLGSSKRDEKERDQCTLFVRFVKAVFEELGISVRVDSALRVWRRLDELNEVSRGYRAERMPAAERMRSHGEMTREDELRHVVRVIAAFVWNVHLKRAVAAAGPLPAQNFWRVIDGNFMDMAAIEWCKLFGSDSEAVHWKNNIPEAEHDAFRKGLYTATGITPEAWKDYRENLKEYRDEHAAHFDLGKFTPGQAIYPQYDAALEACYYYYEWILKQFAREGIQHSYPADIRAYCSEFEIRETGIAAAATKATRGMKETAR